MLQRNLLDKMVKYCTLNLMARICAVYQEGQGLRLALILEDGTMREGISLSQCQFVNERIYHVVAFWDVSQKIRTIKLVREFTKRR